MENFEETEGLQDPIEQTSPYSYYPPIQQGLSDPSLIRYMLNSQDIIKFIEKTLMGFKLNDKDKWEQDESVRPLKKEAINIIIRILRSQLPRTQILANLEYNDVIRMARSLRLNIIDAIYENWELFTYEDEDITDPNLSLCDEIVNLIDHNCFSNLTRAKNGTENRLLRTIYRAHDMGQVVSRSVETQSRNPFSGIFRRKRFFVPRGIDESNFNKIIG